MLTKERRSSDAQSKGDLIEMCVPALAEYISLIRLTLSDALSRADVIYDDIEDIKIAVNEAVTNTVKHTYKENNNVGITNIYFKVLEDRIKIITFDKGDSLDYKATKSKVGPYNKDENIDFLREGGSGLFSIESLMDEVIVYKESGVTISMTKYTKKEQV